MNGMIFYFDVSYYSLRIKMISNTRVLVKSITSTWITQNQEINTSCISAMDFNLLHSTFPILALLSASSKRYVKKLYKSVLRKSIPFQSFLEKALSQKYYFYLNLGLFGQKKWENGQICSENSSQN